MPSCGGLALEAEVEPEFEVEDELEAEASCFGGFFVVFCCVGFLRSSCLLRSGGAEAKAFFALAGKAFGSAATGATGATTGATGSDWAALALGRHAKLSARPAGAGIVSPFARTFAARASPWMGLLPGAPSSSSESFEVAGVFPPVSGTTGPISGRSAGFASDGAGSTGPDGSATGTRLLIYRLSECST